ncbi:MAG: hypothetical protein MI806_26675 [Minwuiales bacterium]|nr:hypothetical protein [Minwuiales bacterium]
MAFSGAGRAAAELGPNWYADAGAALAQGDCGVAVDLLERAASAGERRGLYPARAFFLFHDCAEPDAAERIYRIGLRFADGDGMPRSEKASVAWLEWAEYLNLPAARHALAMGWISKTEAQKRRADTGFDHEWVAENRLKWAAMGGYGPAERDYALFHLAEQGGVPRTLDAPVWLLRAKRSGIDVEAELAAVREHLSDSQWQRAAERAESTPAETEDLWWEPNYLIAQNKFDCEGAIGILDAAVKSGSLRALRDMARIHQDAEDYACFSPSPAERKAFLELAAERLPDDLRTQLRLATFYLDGPYRDTHSAEATRLMRLAVLQIGPRPPELFEALLDGLTPHSELGATAFREAVDWYQAIAPDRGVRHYRVAQMFLSGDGVPRDKARAGTWLQSAAHEGVIEARYDLAMLMLEEPTTPEVMEQAVRHLSTAAHEDYGPAQAEMGRRLAAGDGIERDDPIAYLWLARAGMNGEPVDALKTEVGERLSVFERAWLWTWAFAHPVIDWVFEAVVTVLNWVARLLS